MTEFDIILGMTFFSPYYVELDCNTKSLTVEILRREKVEWEGWYKPKQPKIILSHRVYPLAVTGIVVLFKD